MKDTFLMLSAKIQNILMSEEGQDLIEYALIAAVVALAAVSGMSALATKINSAFGSIGTTLAGYAG
jgi:pilus assembly protein Flp/PilA